MYMKLSYFNFSSYDPELKATKIPSTLPWEETWSGARDKLPSFRKMLVTKLFGHMVGFMRATCSLWVRVFDTPDLYYLFSE